MGYYEDGFKDGSKYLLDISESKRQDGYDLGYAVGHKEGYQDGLDDGYASGYMDGQADRYPHGVRQPTRREVLMGLGLSLGAALVIMGVTAYLVVRFVS